MSKRLVVLFPTADALAQGALQQFLLDTSSNRPRQFEEIAEGVWHGSIRYGSEKLQQMELEVRQEPNGQPVDWCIAKTPGFLRDRARGRCFTTSTSFVGPMASVLPSARHHLVILQARPNDWRYRCIANQLAAEITNAAIDQQSFLAFPGGIDGGHRQHFDRWIEQEAPIHLISACCLHADEGRGGITDVLDDHLVSLLCRVARSTFEKLPHVADWRISTFGPNDYDWLGDLGIMKVLLPYMWNAPKDQVLHDLRHNLDLTEQLVVKLNDVLPFPVSCEEISSGATAIDIEYLVRSSNERAAQMLPKLMEPGNTPLIFKQLRTDEERFARIQQEAFLYLYDTIRYGQKEGEDRPAVLYVGLEVHGGYWAHGDLFVGPASEYLPLGWLPQAVRQHWAPWTRKQVSLERERTRLEKTLSYLGY